MHTQNPINLHLTQFKKVTKFQSASLLSMSNFSPFHLGCPLCSTSILSPLLPLILQNWRKGRGVRVGVCCMCGGVPVVVTSSTCASVGVTNAHGQYLNATTV